MAKNNVRPDFEIPKEFQQNLAIAENMAQTGMPQQQYNNAVNNIGRNQAGALRQFGRTGNQGSLASVLRASNDATMNLDAQDAGARQNNQRFAIGQRGQMGQLQLQKQQWEKIGKYEENANAAAAMQGAGQQNKFGALNSLSNIGQLAMMQGGFGDNASPVANTFGNNFDVNNVSKTNSFLKAGLGKSAFPVGKTYNPMVASNNSTIWGGSPYAMPKFTPSPYKMPWAK